MLRIDELIFWSFFLILDAFDNLFWALFNHWIDNISDI